MTNDYAPCNECGEMEAHNLHHDVSNPMLRANPHFDECDYDVEYVGDPLTPRITTNCHEYIPGCYCADNGQCEYCVEHMVDYADYLRDAAKEG